MRTAGRGGSILGPPASPVFFGGKSWAGTVLVGQWHRQDLISFAENRMAVRVRAREQGFVELDNIISKLANKMESGGLHREVQAWEEARGIWDSRHKESEADLEALAEAGRDLLDRKQEGLKTELEALSGKQISEYQRQRCEHQRFLAEWDDQLAEMTSELDMLTSDQRFEELRQCIEQVGQRAILHRKRSIMEEQLAGLEQREQGVKQTAAILRRRQEADQMVRMCSEVEEELNSQQSDAGERGERMISKWQDQRAEWSQKLAEFEAKLEKDMEQQISKWVGQHDGWQQLLAEVSQWLESQVQEQQEHSREVHAKVIRELNRVVLTQIYDGLISFEEGRPVQMDPAVKNPEYPASLEWADIERHIEEQSSYVLAKCSQQSDELQQQSVLWDQQRADMESYTQKKRDEWQDYLKNWDTLRDASKVLLAENERWLKLEESWAECN